MSSRDYPTFAVVGHPNKGKSSIVSTLALDDSIQIGDTPGTTQIKRSFPLKVDGKVVYELFDTPGFQRARRVLSWIEDQGEIPAHKRPDVLRRFVEAHKDDSKFRDEIELLTPILNGAGIIYVVDASKPYGSEYEVEMEILRWCGKPSMAILNLIGDDDYREEWTQALGQYFRLVRTFNPLTSGHEEHLALLDSMSQLKEEWTKSIKEAMVVLDELYTQKVEQSLEMITKTMIKVLSYVEKKNMKGETASTEEEEQIKIAYQKRVVSYEKEENKAIEQIWNHRNLEKNEDILMVEEIGLFSQESASIFGLSQKELVLTGASAGAVGGMGIDLLTAGHSLFLGSIIGGIVGGVGAMFGFDNLYEVKVLGKKVGKRELSVGPMQNLNFPYVLLGRMLYHATVMAQLSHASREDIELKESSFTADFLNSSVRKDLEKVHAKLRKGEDLNEEERSEYKSILSKSFKRFLTKKEKL